MLGTEERGIGEREEWGGSAGVLVLHPFCLSATPPFASVHQVKRTTCSVSHIC